MRLIAASHAPSAVDWLATANHAHVDASFGRAFNLVNMRGQFLSVVAEEIGGGPFAMVLADAPESLEEIVSVGATAFVVGKNLFVDTVIVDFSEAVLWQPRPDWERLAAASERDGSCLGKLRTLLLVEAPVGSMVTLLDTSQRATCQTSAIAADALKHFSYGVVTGNVRQLAAGVSAFAGLGGGLTPAGDDFLMGALHALWASNGSKKAIELSEAILDVAAARTTQLSAAWLRAAARGEAGERWHPFLDALLTGKTKAIVRAARRILATGHTSGADALAGFLITMRPDYVYSIVGRVAQKRYYGVSESTLMPT